MRADAQRNRARILAAADEVFATHGPDTSTEEVARRAGVAVGTVFRHFATKQDLLAAIMKARLVEITARAQELAADPAGGLYTFMGEVVGIAGDTRMVAELLGLQVGEQVAALRATVQPLLGDAQRAGTVRTEVGIDEVLALLSATCQGAASGGWSAGLRERSLAIIFAGLRPTGSATFG